AIRAGAADVEYPAAAPLASLTSRPCIRFPRQAQFDPIKYLSAVMAAIQRMGGKVIPNTPVETVEETNGKVSVRLADGTDITASHAIVATNSPIVSQTVHTRQAPYRTYAIAVDVNLGSVPHALYWDTLDPYHYVRLQRGIHAEP